MGSLIIRLLTIINTEDIHSTNHHIAKTFLKYYDQIKTNSIDEMARLVNVSKSTLSKFAREIGFDSYIHLKDEAKFSENKYQNKYNYLSNIESYMTSNDYEDYFDMIKEDIVCLKDNVDLSAIDRLVEDLMRYKEVAIFGLLFSESAAIDLQYKLAYNHKFTTTYQDDLKQEEYIRNADEDTLLIILTNSGNFLREQQTSPGKPPKRYFEHTKAKNFTITSDKNILNLDYVKDALIYFESSGLQTHYILYQILFDLIVTRYRAKVIENKHE